MTAKNAPRWVSQIEKIILDCQNPSYSTTNNTETLERANGWLRTLVNGDTLTSGRVTNFLETLERRCRVVLEHPGDITLSPNQMRQARSKYPTLATKHSRTKLSDYVSRTEHEALKSELLGLIEELRGEITSLKAVSTPVAAEPAPPVASLPSVNPKATSTHDISLWRNDKKLYGNINVEGTTYRLQFKPFSSTCDLIHNHSTDVTWANQIRGAGVAYGQQAKTHQASALYADGDKFCTGVPARTDAIVLLWWDGEDITVATLVDGEAEVDFTRATRGTAQTFYKGFVR